MHFRPTRYFESLHMEDDEPVEGGNESTAGTQGALERLQGRSGLKPNPLALSTVDNTGPAVKGPWSPAKTPMSMRSSVSSHGGDWLAGCELYGRTGSSLADAPPTDFVRYVQSIKPAEATRLSAQLPP